VTSGVDLQLASDGGIEMSTFPGFAHVVLTVSDLERSIAWYQKLFDAAPDHVTWNEPFSAAVWHFEDRAVALHCFSNRNGDHFDELRPGLDHLAFSCDDREELESWASKLEQLGIQHSEIVDAPYGSGLAFRDPDNIALEFFAPPPSTPSRSI
jgi:glyoxylase I family protein